MAGRRIGVAISALADRRYTKDLAILRWFDTYQLTNGIPDLPSVPSGSADAMEAELRGDAVQGVLHELLAARLTRAPEADVDGIRTVFTLTLRDVSPADLTHQLFEYFDTQICTMVRRLEKAHPVILQEVRQEALAGRMIAVLQAIERHAAALRGRPDRREEEDFLRRYKRHVAEEHGKLEPPDFERRRRVAIADLYVPPDISQADGAVAGEPHRKVNLWQLFGEIDRTVLIGNPGAGKTSAVNALMHHAALQGFQLVPFLVTLRDFASEDPPRQSVRGYLEHRLETFYQCTPPAGTVGGLLLTGRAMVIFDGLDELVDPSRRADVSARIERFCAEYPLTRVLVTSRMVGYDQARLDDRQFARYQISGFNEFQVASYVRNWFTQEEGVGPHEAGTWTDAFMDESSEMQELRASPLMLALMCILYRGEGSIPRNRAEIYEQCANLLFRKWDSRRHIYLNMQAGYLFEPTLRHLAWWLLTKGPVQFAVTERELTKETVAFLLGRGFESESRAREAATEFVGFCRGRMWVFSDTGTTATGDRLYSFTHRTFLEYFAAAELAFSCDSPESLASVLAKRVARGEWEVVGELAVQIKDQTSRSGAERIITAILRQSRRRSAIGRSYTLQFLARCLRSVNPPPPTTRKLVREILDFALAGHLDDDDRCLPLCWLAASCSAFRDIVSDEISAYITRMIESDDAPARLNGLRIALWLTIGISGNWGGRGPDVPSQSRLVLFWRQWQRRNALRYAASITTAAIDDHGMRDRALNYELLTVDQAIQMPDSLTALVTTAPMGIFGGTESPYLVSRLPDFIQDSTDESLDVTTASDFACAGRYLASFPPLPWATKPLEMWITFFNDCATPPVKIVHPDPTAYAGAAGILLMLAETAHGWASGAGAPQQLGPLSDLCPYIARRWGAGETGTLPDLPVPDALKRAFRDWAENKINFVVLQQSLTDQWHYRWLLSVMDSCRGAATREPSGEPSVTDIGQHKAWLSVRHMPLICYLATVNHTGR